MEEQELYLYLFIDFWLLLRYMLTFPSVEKLSWNKKDKQSMRSIPRACKVISVLLKVGPHLTFFHKV